MPYIMPSQAHKHVTHNLALDLLDAVVQLAVLSRITAAPPTDPGEGDRFIVPAGATGAWAGQAGKVAVSRPGGWMLLAPRRGWLAWLGDEARLVGHDGEGWVDVVGSALNPALLVGVNTSADATNRLAVSAPATLFSHDGGDHRVKINKAAAGDTASLVFQTAYSGRAEFGLAGGDDFSVKVSADGAAWTEALRVDADTGLATVGGDPVEPLGVATRQYAMSRHGDTMTGVLGLNGVSHTPQPGPVGTMLHVSNQGDSTRVLFDNYVSAGSGPNFSFRKARGTAASPSALQAGDLLFNIATFGFGATQYNAASAGGIMARTIEGWTDTARGTEIAFSVTPAGTAATVSHLRLTNLNVRFGDGGANLIALQMNGANTVVSAERHFMLRSYTVASLPSASPEGQLIYVSNGSANRRMAVSDGSNWRFPDGAIVS
jgi:hypothetical protein